MQVEYEATFTNIDKENVRSRLRNAGASLVKEEFLQKRTTFNPPKDSPIKNSWVRVRDEGDKVTASIKALHGDAIEDQKEIDIEVNDYNLTVKIFESLGCTFRAYQETKRELWSIDGVDVTIDTWPFLESFVEVEGKNEKEVKEVSKKLGFDYSRALFCAVATLYNKKYGVPIKVINEETPKIVFDMKNPFSR